MSRFQKIIFMDEDNTGFSSYAAEVLKKKNLEGDFPVSDISSAGVVVLFEEPVNRKIEEVARLKGINLSGLHARGVRREDFSESTLVLTIDMETKRRAYTKFPEAVNIYTLKEYVGANGDIKFPAGKSLGEFTKVCKNIDKLIDKLIEKFKE